ncbi:MAG: reprolysin-like metallopeptidase [Tepidisphaeraceae bacterium]
MGSRSKTLRRANIIERLERRRLLTSTPAVVDLLAVYTPAAASLHGGDAGIANDIQASVDAMNRALINSEISITIRLVHAEPISYTGSNDLFVDRTRLENPGDGFMDSVHTLRNQKGADLVTLIVDGSVAGGNASLMTNISSPNNPNLAFSAIAQNSIGPYNLTLAHELGHNLGGGHERNNPHPGQNVVGPFSYSYGYRYQSNGRWHNDIMSYAYAPLEIPLAQYANPNISIDGAATGKPAGDPESADIASTFAQTAPVVASYRTSNVVADTSGPAASVFEINRTGASADFVVRYIDASGIDLSTLGAGDITVSGPGGFALPATFVGMDHPTIAGGHKFATYHVTLPATNPATSSLTFNLAAGEVKDINNNSAAAGALSMSTAPIAGYSYAWAQDLGALSLSSTHTEFGRIEPLASDHFYQFTLASNMTVGVALTDMTGNGNLLVSQDTNNNGWFDGGEEFIWSDNTGALDEGRAKPLTPGTYYVKVYPLTVPTTTPYTLWVHAYNDVTPPTATLDATDVRTAGATHIDFSVTYSDDNEVDGLSTLFDAGVLVDGSATSGWSFFQWPDQTLNTSRANAASRTV